MIEKYPRDWDGSEWEQFSLRLVRERHGATNVQSIPARVKGDLGIECFTTDGCVYQSYAPEETGDTAKAASAMRAKANRDLGKLAKNEDKIGKLLSGMKITRWIMLCPFLDDKEVVTTVAARAQKILESGLPFIDSDFHGLVHCQEDFSKEIDRIRLEACGAPITLKTPNTDEIAQVGNTIDETLDQKIGRGFPNLDSNQASIKKDGFIRTHIRSENALEQLKRDAPELWEKATTAIALEEDRLETSGTVTGPTGDLLTGEQDRLYQALTSALPTLETNALRAIAMGQIGTWLIECPLDFTTSSSGASE
nr:hypothetical protein [uncultured Hyphomonas sp.]